MASRTIDGIFDTLESLNPQQGEYPFPAGEYHPVLAKTLLVHAANWGMLREVLGNVIPKADLDRRRISRLLGYGALDNARLVAASSNKALLLGAASITSDQRQTFTLPLPASLAATTEWRRLTITLGWLSEVNPRSRSTAWRGFHSIRLEARWASIERRLTSGSREPARFNTRYSKANVH